MIAAIKRLSSPSFIVKRAIGACRGERAHDLGLAVSRREPEGSGAHEALVEGVVLAVVAARRAFRQRDIGRAPRPSSALTSCRSAAKHRGVKRRVAGAGGVRIRAAFEEQLARPRRDRCARLRPARWPRSAPRSLTSAPAVEQSAADCGVAHARREQQRREATEIESRDAADAVLIAVAIGDLHGPAAARASGRRCRAPPAISAATTSGMPLRDRPHQRGLCRAAARRR